MDRIGDLERENADLRQQLKRASMVIGTLPENMSLDQLIDYQSARLTKKGYLWWAFKMVTGAAMFFFWVILIFTFVSLATGTGNINCTAG
jgi:hypothetical protein